MFQSTFEVIRVSLYPFIHNFKVLKVFDRTDLVVVTFNAVEDTVCKWHVSR
jgi:hypothetical protein